jgi:TolA-binding protein
MKARTHRLAQAAVWLTALVVCLGVGYAVNAADEPPPAPPPKAAAADTPEGVKQQIAQLEKQIDELNAEAEKLVNVEDQDKRTTIRKQIKSLRLQVRILEHRLDQLSDSASQSGVDQVRERYRQRIREYEAQKSAIRRQTIARFEEALGRNPNSNLAPDILWRLGNLYFEEAHATYLEAWDRYETEMDRLYNQGATNVVPEEPKHNYGRSVELLSRILRDFPSYEHKDKTLYLLAYCLQEQNDDDRALMIYQQLITESPKSESVPEAYVRMGEIHFARDQYDKAIERYQQVLQFPKSKFYDKALYKLGWSYYKTRDYDAAVKYFSDVLRYYRERPVTAGRKGKGDDLRQESLDYIAISFTEAEGLNGAGAAVSFMQKFGDRDLGRQILLKVGEVYDERTDYEPARQAYRAYLQNFPLAPEVPEVYSKIAQTYEKESRFEEAVQIYSEIGTKLGPDSEWARVNANVKTAEVSRAAKFRQTSFLAAATFHHEKAQKAGGAEAQAHYQKAIESYEIYLANYPDSDGAYETAFNVAECYMELQQYPQAAAKYQKVIEIKKDKDLWANALFNRAKAYELQVEKEGGLPNKEAITARDKAASSGDKAGTPKTVEIKPTAMSATTGNWVKSLGEHVENLPDSDKSPAMLYKIGEIYYLHGDFDNARVYFKQVFDKYPKSDVVAFASYWFIETYKQRQDYAGLKEATRVVPESSKLGLDTTALKSLSAGATFKIAEQKLRDSTSASPVVKAQVQDAIDEYQRGIAENPNDKLADVAMLNIAVAYENHIQDLIRANEAYLYLAKNYPKSQHAPDALLKAAFNYQVLVEFDKAVEAYELFYQSFPGHKEAGNALYNAAVLREESGQSSAAVSLYQQYLGKHATAADASEVSFNVARLYEKSNNLSAAEQAYDAYAKRGADNAERMSEAYFRWGKILEDRGQTGEAEKRYLQAVAVFVKAKSEDPKAEVNARYAAEAQFRVTSRFYEAYKSMAFTGNLKKDANVLKEKAEAFKRLKDNYEQIVTFGNYQWATAALHMIGVINQDFSESLLKAPVPKDLPPEQQDEYIFKLEEIAFPIKNRALEAFKQNVAKGVSERVVNEWIVKSYLELKKLEPQAVEPKFEKTTASDVPALATAGVDPTLPAAPVAPPPTTPGADAKGGKP